MEVIKGLITVNNVVIILLLFSSVWLFKVIIKRQNEYLIRAVLIFLLFMFAFLYLQENKSINLNFSDIKDRIFPQKIVNYKYHIEKGFTKNAPYTRYIFKNPKPKISLCLDKSGKYFHIKNIKPVNKVLESLNLPKVTKGVLELSAITGSQYDMSCYRWDDYPEGTLLIEKDLCKDKNSLTIYHCIATLKIIGR